MKGHMPKYDRVVIGSTMPAVAYAYENELPIFFAKHKAPFFFDLAENGKPKLEAYMQMLYVLSLAGNVPFYDNINLIKIDDDILSIATKDSRLIKAKFEKAIIFDEEGVAGLDAPETPEQPEYMVLDWFNVRAGMCHEHDILESSSDFIKQVYFYPSERIDGNHDKKDLVAVSYLTEEQVKDIDYSEIYAKFKILNMMTEAGITGPKNGITPTGQPRLGAIKIESASREIRKLTRPDYSDTERLHFNREATI